MRVAVAKLLALSRSVCSQAPHPFEDRGLSAPDPAIARDLRDETLQRHQGHRRRKPRPFVSELMYTAACCRFLYVLLAHSVEPIRPSSSPSRSEDHRPLRTPALFARLKPAGACFFDARPGHERIISAVDPGVVVIT
jgi:hypothetical protein